jgi:cobalt/nickel transport protein
MKKYLAAVALILVFLAIFIPFASSNPDGLEKVAETFGIEEHEPFWKGVMSDYSVEAVGDPYVSTLLAGVCGTLLVLFAAFILGTAIVKKPSVASDKQCHSGDATCSY